jgi:CheY-like chemotaxis protein
MAFYAFGICAQPHVDERHRADAAAHANREEPAQWLNEDQDPAIDLTGVTVLLVEDEAISREALETIFTYHGAHVIGVATAMDALAAYECSLPTVLVSDIGLPQEDGCALLRAIRTREFGRGRHTPAIAISAFPSRETGERARGAGFDAFLPKPIEVPALLRTIRDFSAPTA